MAKKGRPAYVPNKKDLQIVKSLASAGVPAEKICETLEIGKNTLYKHYKKEIQTAALDANAAVVGSLFKMATNGNVAAAIFWLKTRMKWAENTAPSFEDSSAEKKPHQATEVIINAEPMPARYKPEG